MKQKKEYMRPTMMVVELKQTGILMASGDGNSVGATMDGTFIEEDA